MPAFQIIKVNGVKIFGKSVNVNFNKKINFGFTMLLILSCTVGFIAEKYEENKAKSVMQQQERLHAEKELEEQIKQEELKKLEEQNKLEQMKQKEQKRLKEQKKIDEQKQKEDEIKIKQAINGQGNSRRIPILMYHSIDYEKGNELRIPKDKFREQMKYLKDNGFTTISLDELYSHMVFGMELPDKPIVITLDDGYSDNYTNAYPVLKEFNFKATVFMITMELYREGPYLTIEQIKEMNTEGIDIEPHTVSHPHLAQLPYDKQLDEIKTSKETLEKVLGREVKYFAYPFGNFNNDTLKAVQDAGIKMALNMTGGIAKKQDGIYKLSRIYVSNNYNMDYFKVLINQK